MSEPKTLKGFRDFLPKEERKRQYILDTLKKVFALYGFEPLETPALEYEEILTGKYGDEGEKLMYKFEDNGKRKVALRYDQTVPLARVISQYQNEISLPFKRYQIQNVWRAENTQRGRYREFLQVDVDTIGIYSPLADAEILSLVYDSFKNLGLEIEILINDRLKLSGIENKYLTSIDKLGKIGAEEVIKELEKKGLTKEEAERTLRTVKDLSESDRIKEVKGVFEKMGKPKEVLVYKPVLIRGLDYYTGIIFEVVLKNKDKTLSLGGGGRFDNLIGIFAGRDIPAVGFSFGFDRIMETMEELSVFSKIAKTRDVFVAFSNPELQQKAFEILNKLRQNNINSEFYLEDSELKKQLRYADKKGISFAIIAEEDGLILKDMEKGTQEKLTFEEILKELNSVL